MTFVLVEAASDRAALGRRIIAALAGTVIGVGLLVRLGPLSPNMPAALPPPIATPPPVVARPPVVESGGGHRLVIPADANGSCYLAARANGALFEHMLLDTGNSGRLAFGRNHAEQLGYDPARLSYNSPYWSANGVGREASVRLREFRVDTFVMHDVPASITEQPMEAVLVPVDILHRLRLRLGGGNCELLLP